MPAPRRKSALVKVLVALTVTLLASGVVVYHHSRRFLDARRLAALVAQWEGFGPERGCYNFTVVTSLLDVGRGRWAHQNRSYEAYLGYLLQILQLDVNLVVFIEPKGAPFVRHARRGRESRTLVVETHLSDLPYSADLDRVAEVMGSATFQQDNSNWQQGKVEATVPWYDVVTNSKAGLTRRAIRMNPFHTNAWVWLDAGLTHGNSIFPQDGVWYPQALLADLDRVTFACFYHMDKWKGSLDLHKIDTATMIGGYFSGGTVAMLVYAALHDQAWHEMLQNNAVDDDQTTFALTYFKNPDNFNPVLVEDWFDLVRSTAPESSTSRNCSNSS